jgi:hypothetical protein
MIISDSKFVPPQHEGGKADIVETFTASDNLQAKRLFVKARDRLFDIASWGDISEGISASFQLTDKNGNIEHGLPKVGDHIRINIPGPGSSAGAGYDWVRIEIVQEGTESEKEFAVIKVRPSAAPEKQKGTAHFFDSAATSSFIVKREKRHISAEIHGRNEKPNMETEKVTDQIRNLVVGSAATSGFAKIQWQKLAKGLLNFQVTES